MASKKPILVLTAKKGVNPAKVPAPKKPDSYDRLQDPRFFNPAQIAKKTDSMGRKYS